MTAMKSALIASGVIDIPALLKKDFLHCARFDKELRTLFVEFPKAATKQEKISRQFVLWMHDYNKAAKGANNWSKPEYPLPLEMYDCAREFGYRWSDDLSRVWSYMRYLLEEAWLVEFQAPDDETMSMQTLVLSTIALVDGILAQDGHENMRDVMEAQLKNLLGAMGIDRRGIWASKDQYQTVLNKAIAAVNEWDNKGWDHIELMRIARSIAGSIV
jgi:hypothetical protein